MRTTLTVLALLVLACGFMPTGNGQLYADDCNSNGIDDLQDIAVGTSDDCNSNNIPDECDTGPQRQLVDSFWARADNSIPGDKWEAWNDPTYASPMMTQEGQFYEADVQNTHYGPYAVKLDESDWIATRNNLLDFSQCNGVTVKAWVKASDGSWVGSLYIEYYDGSDWVAFGQLNRGDPDVVSYHHYTWTTTNLSALWPAPQARIRFRAATNSHHTYWYIDDVEIFGHTLAGRDWDTNGQLDECADCDEDGTPDAHGRTSVFYDPTDHNHSGVTTVTVIEPGSLDLSGFSSAKLSYNTFSPNKHNYTRVHCKYYDGSGWKSLHERVGNQYGSGWVTIGGELPADALTAGFGLRYEWDVSVWAWTVNNINVTVFGYDDANGSGIPDYCEDCNTNGILDNYDIAQGTSTDCDSNGIPDECEMVDCNTNTILDICDIEAGTSEDCDSNHVPDECQMFVWRDCNRNQSHDFVDVCDGSSADCNGDLVPDECQEGDCDDDGISDIDEICLQGAADCNFNGLPDDCEPDEDCNANEVRDICDIGAGALDCNSNSVPDECETGPELQLLERFWDRADYSIPGNKWDVYNYDYGIQMTTRANVAYAHSAWYAVSLNQIDWLATKENVLDFSPADAITVRAWVRSTNTDEIQGSMYVQYYDGVNWVTFGQLNYNDPNITTYAQYSWTTTDLAALIAAPEAKIRFLSNTDLTPYPGQGHHRYWYIDDVEIYAHTREGSDWDHNGQLDECADCDQDGTPDCHEYTSLFHDADTYTYSGVVDLTLIDPAVDPLDLSDVPSARLTYSTGETGPYHYAHLDCLYYAHDGTWKTLETRAQIDTDANWITVIVELPADALHATFGLQYHWDCSIHSMSLRDVDLSIRGFDDVNSSGIPDHCEDCQPNGITDDVDIATGTSEDCNNNAMPDECEWHDCNDNTILDACDILTETSADCDADGQPDECQFADWRDCNGNNYHDLLDLCWGLSGDCNQDGIPDECQDDDCDNDRIPDVYAICFHGSPDYNHNGVPDECELDEDCNTNGVRDIHDIADHTSRDCNGNLIPDECESGPELQLVDHFRDRAAYAIPGDKWDAYNYDYGEIMTNRGSMSDSVAQARSAWYAISLNQVDWIATKGDVLDFGQATAITVEAWVKASHTDDIQGSMVVQYYDGVEWITFGQLNYNDPDITSYQQYTWTTTEPAALIAAPEARIRFLAGTDLTPYPGQGHHRYWYIDDVEIYANTPAGNDWDHDGRLDACADCDNDGTPDAHLRTSLFFDATEYNSPDSGDYREIVTGLDLSIVDAARISYWTYETGQHNYVKLTSEYYAQDSMWKEYEQRICEFTTLPWINVIGELPADALHDNFGLRFRWDSSSLQMSVKDIDISATGYIVDTDGNGVPDYCDDCNTNGILDSLDITDGTSTDCNSNDLPDDCEMVDCNTNMVFDGCDIADGTSDDCDWNRIPDECQSNYTADCQPNGTSDLEDICSGASIDCNGDGIPDECQPGVVVPPIAPDSVSSDRNEFCEDEYGITLTAHGGSGDRLEWFEDTCGGRLMGTGNDLRLKPPSGTTTYYARYSNAPCGVTTCASTTVTMFPRPVPPTSASSNRDECCAEDSETIKLAAFGGSGGLTRWFDESCGTGDIGTGNPLTIASPTVTTTYYARYEEHCGSTSCVSVTVTVNPSPAPTITADPSEIVCEDQVPVTLDAGAGYDSYLWSPGDQTTQTIEVNAVGRYHVTVIDANGCQGTDEIEISINSNPLPAITAEPGETVCQDRVPVSLDAGAGYQSYLWSPGGETSQMIEVTTSGTYSVTVTDANGCQGIDQVNIQVNQNPAPQIRAIPGDTICQGNTVTLDARPGYASYLWSPGGETTQTIEVTTAGIYSVMVTDANGCTGTDQVTVTVEPNPEPEIAIDPADTICEGTTVALDAGPGFLSYLWSPGGETVRAINVAVSGTYRVTVTDENSCQGSDQVVITVHPGPKPIISADPAEEVCEGTTVTLDAGPGYESYLWSPGGETTQTINVTDSSSYSVTVTDANGCQGSGEITITQNPSPVPSITVTPSESVCEGTTVTLDAGAGYSSYSWSPGNETTRTISVTTGGTYRVTVTNANGCAGTDEVTITVNPNPTPEITTDPNEAVCEGTTVTLDAGVGYATYRWSPGNETTQTISVTTAGTYHVTVTNANGCAGTDEAVVTMHPNPAPSISANPGDTVCQGTTVTIDAGPGYTSYLWSPGGETTQTIVVKTSGSYSVTVTDANGCEATDEITINVVPNPVPGIAATPSEMVCGDVTVTLDAGPGYAHYLWSPGGETTQTIEVVTSGLYSVKVTDTNGCEGSDFTNITVGEKIPGDLDNDCDVDLIDWSRFMNCLIGPGVGAEPACRDADLDQDNDVDLKDSALLQSNFTG